MTRRLLIRISVGLVALAATGVTVASLTRGNEKARTPDTTAATAATPASAPGTAAMRAYLNPETGKIDVGVAHAPQAAAQAFDPATQNALRRDATGLVEVHHPNGAVTVNLQGRYQSVAVLRLSRDGKKVVCTDDPKDAYRAVQGPAAQEVK